MGRLDPWAVLAGPPARALVAAVVEAVGVVAAAATRRAGPGVAGLAWALASTLSNGALLGPRLWGV